jgi:hypothetical protein
MDNTDIAHVSNQYVEKLNIALKTLRKQKYRLIVVFVS